MPQLADLTDGSAFAAAFLGPALNHRSDGASVNGIDAVDLSGPRADVYVASASTNQLLRVHLRHGVLVDGIADADLRYGNYNHDFRIAVPSDVIDFANLSTLPPDYTVLSVETSACRTPCLVSAQIKNLGGPSHAAGPSTVTFKMAEAVSGVVLGTCSTPVVPDVGYGSTTNVSCTIGATPTTTAVVTASAVNPGRS